MKTKQEVLGEIKATQQTLAATVKRHAEIHRKIVELSEHAGAAQDIEPLVQRRKGLRAEVAMGDSSKAKDLESLNAEIAEIQKNHETAAETLEGLRQSLDLAEVDIKTARDSKRMLLSQYTLMEAEELNAEYMRDAESLAAKFRRLMALGRICKNSCAGHAFSEGTEHKAFSIPVFQLASSGQWPRLPSDVWPKWRVGMEIATNPGSYSEADETAENTRLAGLGIEV